MKTTALRRRVTGDDPSRAAAARANKGPAEHRGNRYGRSEAARQAVLEAADDLLMEIGFAAVTMEGIAARAGVGKQTIYRWWSSKTDVLMDAFLEDAVEYLKPQESGNLRQDLRAHLSNLADFLTRTDPGGVFRALAGEAQHDAKMAVRFRTEYLSRQRKIDRLPLRRAIERGELPATINVERAVDQLVGPIYYRVLVTGDSVDAEFTNSVVAGFLRQFEGHGK